MPRTVSDQLKLIKPLKISGKSEVWECEWQGRRAVVKFGAMGNELDVLKSGIDGLPRLLTWNQTKKGLELVREWVEGVSLAESCEKGLEPTWLIHGVVNAILGLQRNGLPFIHGDISPDNLLVNGQQLRLVDFENSGWGKSVQINGVKWAFAAPEILNTGATVQTDIFSLGKTLEFCGMASPLTTKMTENQANERFQSWNEVLTALDHDS